MTVNSNKKQSESSSSKSKIQKNITTVKPFLKENSNESCNILTTSKSPFNMAKNERRKIQV